MNSPALTAPATALPAERRIASRHQPAFGTVCRIGPQVKSGPTIIGLVWNISETGVSMLIGDPPKAGAEVPGELSSGAGGKGLAVTLRVVHVRPIQTGDFVLGAQFERPLEPEEIRSFLVPESPPGVNSASGTNQVQGPPKKG